MLGIGFGEFVLVGLVLLVVVGPDRLPKVLRWLGRHYGQLRRAADELRRAFSLEADRMEAEERFEKLKERRKKAEEARKKARQEAGAGTVDQPEIEHDEEPELTPGDPQSRWPDEERPDGPPHGPKQPGGFSDEEWEELPPHIQELVLKGIEAEAQKLPADPPAATEGDELA